MKKVYIIVVICIVISIVAGCSIEKTEDRYKMLDTSFVENDYYKVEYPFSINKADKVVSISGNVTCLAPYTEWPGITVFSDLPVSTQNFFVTVSERFGNGAPVRVNINTDGNMYIRYGKAGSLYDIHITYIAQ